MDSSEELYYYRSRNGLFLIATSEYPVGQQHSDSRARIGLDKEHYGRTEFPCLFDAYGGENAVIYRIVEEKDFCGLHKQ